MGSKPINISASRGAAVLGLSEFSTPLQVWLKIMEASTPGFCEDNNYVLPPFEENDAMRWGNAFEDAICELITAKTNQSVIHRERAYEMAGYPYITCHIDGIAGNLQENKTTSSIVFRKKWGEPGTDRVPQSYYLQCQHQMMCTDIDSCDVNVLVFPETVDNWPHIDLDDADLIGRWSMVLNEMGYFHQYHIEKNQTLQDKMLEHYVAFWNNNVIGEKPPEAQDMKDIKALCIEPKGTIVASENAMYLATEHKELGAELSRAKKRRKQLKVELIKYMSNETDVPIDHESREKFILVDETGKKLVTWNGKTFR
jgi:putative phage-type endonuclease